MVRIDNEIQIDLKAFKFTEELNNIINTILILIKFLANFKFNF